MKLITYTLTPEGEIPAYVVTGGQFPVPNNLESPQDYTLVGWATDDAPEDEIIDIKTYLIEIGAETWTNPEGEPMDIDLLVAAIQSIGE